MLSVSARNDPDWLAQVIGSLRYQGCAVVTDVLGDELLVRMRDAMYAVHRRLVADVGQERLDRAGEVGVMRVMGRYDPFFLQLLATPEMLAIVDATVSETAILHLQNGFVLPSQGSAPKTGFQHTYHRDFPRHLDGYLASLNIMVTVDPFTSSNGGTLVVAGTHQRPDRPDQAYLDRESQAVQCPGGSLVVFDSTLWHAAGPNRSDSDRLAINHQFTRSWIKQQIDYVRALGDEVVLAQEDRVQQLLGWYTRVVTSLDEYYVPSDQRLYRSGQG
jgi:ectoine hydroxylase-related dioxygenase (phytanoyl-CoA dioxygenase family)